MKPQRLYSQTGLAMKMPAIAQILSAKVNGSAMPPKFSVSAGVVLLDRR